MLSDTYAYYKIIIINNILLMKYKDIKIMIYINHRIIKFKNNHHDSTKILEA